MTRYSASGSTAGAVRIGCCGSMIAPETDPVGSGAIDVLAAAGYDYVELSLRDVAALDPRAFASLRRRLRDAGLACEACNNFLPSAIRLTGP
ncbi:MAG: hypothetical protein Q7V01_04940, partial [Vicinamibacterales bacterium]|nr:hypothetical protein [Vicinamibacterales bacterium]